MTIQVIRLEAPLSSSKGETFLKLQNIKSSFNWSFLSTNPKRRAQMKKRGAYNVLNPFKQNLGGISGGVWLDEWQSFSGVGFEELLFELFSDQGVELIILSQSFSLKKEEKVLDKWTLNAERMINYRMDCPRYVLSSSQKLIRGLHAFASDAITLKNPYDFPKCGRNELLIPFCIKQYSHLLALARDYEVLAFKGPSPFYLADILLWALGGHGEASLIGFKSENQNRRDFNKEDSLSRSTSYRGVSFKKWKKSFDPLLWWTRWRQENEAYYLRVRQNVLNRIGAIQKH